mmetsp:Transcript_35727/g.81978  ORF Transcript_35727/g.81978 Transcript_35727/m.81978 type:complete len:87 (-) Transcript_35727:1638-1898(-)
MEEFFSNGPFNMRRSFLATSESTALRGSSRRSKSAPEYTARAKDTRCFWPPERFTPFSPISVSSPLGRVCKSGSSAHALITASYLA